MLVIASAIFEVYLKLRKCYQSESVVTRVATKTTLYLPTKYKRSKHALQC